jgi:hypothetical protein
LDIARTTTIEGQPTLVVENQSSLPKGLAMLLTQMAPFGFAERADFTLAGTRPACDVLRVHRWQTFRVGRWSNLHDFGVPIGHDNVGGQLVPRTVTVPRGVRNLRLEMCADCGAVAVHDITPEKWAGARPIALVNLATGERRVASAVGQPDRVIGWYSGKRRAGREYR